MSKDYMITIVKPPNKPPTVIKISKRLRDMEKIVGGILEEARYEKVLIIYNENQNDTKLEVNNIFNDLSMKGTILITGNDEKNGDVRSLNRSELVKYLKKINHKRRDIQNEIEYKSNNFLYMYNINITIFNLCGILLKFYVNI